LFTRTTGLVIVPLWLAAVAWLVAHDVWPSLTALPAPPLLINDWLRTEGLRSSYVIEDEFGSIGTVWSEYFVDQESIRREDVIWIRRLSVLPPPLRITVSSVYTGGGELDELTIRAESTGAEMKLHGERFHSDFSFVFESGPIEKAFKVPLTDGRMISGAFHPFGGLANLQVGQRWRMQVVNPIAYLTGFGSRFIPLLVEVTGEERIDTPLGQRNCLILESDRAKAWVDARGAVIKQEMSLPVLGTLRILRQNEFDETARAEARGAYFGHR
jgi:hypothetical protein